MRRELLTAAMVLALAVHASAGEAEGEGAATEEMTELNEAGQAVTELNLAASTIRSEQFADVARLRDRYAGLAGAMLESACGRSHVHLAQSIACARSSGVTPPRSM